MGRELCFLPGEGVQTGIVTLENGLAVNFQNKYTFIVRCIHHII